MTQAQKEALRDLFEGCFDFFVAVESVVGLDNEAAFQDASATWRRWQEEMDEVGHYTF